MNDYSKCWVRMGTKIKSWVATYINIGIFNFNFILQYFFKKRKTTKGKKFRGGKSNQLLSRNKENQINVFEENDRENKTNWRKWVKENTKRLKPRN